MALIDRYIGEVTRRLPVKERDDIGQELRSTMEDLLPAGYSEKEERELLMKFGDPAVFAGKYRSQPRYLIGSRFFDIYLTLLKIIIPIVVTVVVVVLIISTIFSGAGDASLLSVMGTLFGDAIAAAFDVAVGVFFWVTIVFVIIEWVDRSNQAAGKPPLAIPDKGWTPDDLKDSEALMPKKKTIPRNEPAFDLIWIAIWVSLYFNADRFIGIYEEGASGLAMVTPAFDQALLLSFWPLVVFTVTLQVLLDVWKWTRRRWDLRLATFNFVVNALSVLVFFLIFRNPQIFTADFLDRVENLFGSLSSLNWIVGSIIFGVAIFAAIDTIAGFWKAASRKETPMKGCKIGKG